MLLYVYIFVDELAKIGISVVRGRGRRSASAVDESHWADHNAFLQFFNEDAAGPSLSTLSRGDDGK